MQNSAFEQEVLRLTNEFRRQNGLNSLTIDQSLERAADQHSQDMATKDFFSHTGSDNSRSVDRAKRAGYESGFVGENIAAGYRTAEAVVEGWKSSPGHRANMLNPDYNEIGLGYYFLENDTGSTNYNSYWTQVFGKGTVESPTPPSQPPSQPPSKPKPQPSPQPVPVSNNTVIQGTDRADNLVGGSNHQRIFGKGGNDTLNGKGGNDRLYGDGGADRLWGDVGNDRLWGGLDNDRLWGGSGNDRLWGDAGNDQLRGDSGNDQLRGGTGNDLLWGGANNDRLWGGSGNDRLWGDANNDRLWGGSGNDHLLGGSGNDQLLGEFGSDKLEGGDGNDRLQGARRNRSAERDILTGGRGRDTFVLGDRTGSFYDDGNARSMGTSNYAVISDLNIAQGDIIQLSSRHDYRLGSAPRGVGGGQALFIDNDGGTQDELIAVIRGANNLNLNSNTFRMV